MPSVLNPLERRWLFSKLLAQWVLEAFRLGYRVELCEVGVLEKRKSRWGIPYTDGVHKRASLHYGRQAADPIIWKQINGQWTMITRGDDPSWTVLGEAWENLDPLCRWGMRFTGKSAGDANHLSIAAEDGRA